ncbi:hypothetical protein VPH35_077242 [Triticum aestivum]
MEFLMQPIRRCQREGASNGAAALPRGGDRDCRATPMATASADRQMCVAEGGLATDGDAEPQACEQAGLAGLGLELLLQEGHLALGEPTLLRRQYGGSLTNRATL